jgi:AcrR family transcriptional regulator
MESKVRDQIVEAAFEILCEEGPSRLRVHEVARRAGVSPTLLYYYFDGKHALIAAAYAKDYAEILATDRAAVEVILGGTESVIDFAERVSKVVADQGSPERRKRRFAVLAIAQTDQMVADAIRDENRSYFEFLKSLMLEGQQRGWLDQGVDISALALLWMAAPLGMVYGDLDPMLTLDVPTVLNTLYPPARSEAPSGADAF